MSTQEKYIGEAKLKDEPRKKLGLQLSEKGLEKVAMTGYKKMKPYIDALQNQINTMASGGTAISTMFGDSDSVGVSQKTLTQAFNQLWNKLSEITGEVYQGISMVVTPSYYIGEDGCNIHITATTVDTNGIFEKLKLFINNQLIAEEEYVDFFDMDAEINDTSVIKCEAQILGITYIAQKTVVHNASFWLGAAISYASIMDISHVISVNNNMRGSYNIQCNANDHIYIVIANSLREGFIRADINGVEIPFTESTVTLNGIMYNVFTSLDTYAEGIYNIDING